ncbi:putative RNA recognition motif containing protein [Lyophyllum shimeji]|uniref:RNA recognition motif containing protein n=1 Tax=Lyophyllum shimeji TaxID=47721 RepID=A0A9P3PET4_LYOSH|nr:putative RNA recognition motif containing protein [Lyophyllum shimeji]
MNVVKEINKINQRELDLGISGASWHDEYKDSAYIFIGGLHYDLTEGDVITIFSQYGEVMDLNMPRDKETGKPRGFGFLMYEDQRSTILAVDNLNGAKVLEKTLRVDHVKNYKQPKVKGEDGEWVELEEQSLNAKPELIYEEDPESDSSVSSGPPIDPEDPMYEYLLAKRKEEKTLKKAKKAKSKSKHKDETPEERRARKARKREKRARKAKSEGVKAVEDLLKSLGRRGDSGRSRSPSPGRRRLSRTRSKSPMDDRDRKPSTRAYSPPRSRSPDTRRRHPIGRPDEDWRGESYGYESRSRRSGDYD